MRSHYPHEHIRWRCKEDMKVDKMQKAVADKEIADHPKQVKGAWKTLFAELKAKGEGAKVSGLTRGQVSSAQRQAKDSGFSVVAVDKGTAVIISPPEAKKPASK